MMVTYWSLGASFRPSFQVCQKLFGYFCILVFLICWCEVISASSGYPHFLWEVTRDQLYMCPSPPHPPFPLPLKMF